MFLDHEALDPAILTDVIVRYRDYVLEGAKTKRVGIRSATIAALSNPD